MKLLLNEDEIQVEQLDTKRELQQKTPPTLMIESKQDDYFEFLNYDIWQKIVIPLTDFGEASGSINFLRSYLVVEDKL